MDAARLFIESQNVGNTRRAYSYDLARWFDYLSNRAPTVEDAISFRSYIEGRFKPSTAARIYNTCRSFYRWSNLDNPFEHLKSPRRVKNATPTVPDDIRVAAVIDGVSNDPTGLRGAVVSLLLNGLRSEEVVNLHHDALVYSPEYDCHLLTVIGKGNKARTVPATTETVQTVSRYLNGRPNGSPWLLNCHRGKQMTTRQVRYVMEKASGGTMSPHKLRHHYGTRLARADVNVFALKDLMGHESVATTQIYVSMNMNDLVKASQLDPRNQVGKKGLRVVA